MTVYMVKYKLVGKDEEKTVEGYKRATPYYKTKGAAKTAWTYHTQYWGSNDFSRVEYVRIATMELKEIDSEYIIPKKE